jgi:autotransporter passenger strand-loop-strand repeat protein
MTAYVISSDVFGATAVVGGSTLMVSDGGNAYDFKLAGSLTGTPSVTSDGHGGALFDPPAARPATAPPTTVVISSGVTSSGLTVGPGDQLTVLSGGEADGVTVFPGGTASVSDGGIISSVVAGGALDGEGELTGSSTAFGFVGPLALSNGILILSAGATASSLVVAGGGGVVNESVMSDVVLLSGGADLGLGLERGTTVFGLQELEGGAAYNTVVSSGGIEFVGNTSIASGTLVLSGGILLPDVADLAGLVGATVSGGGIYVDERPNVGSGQVLTVDSSTVTSTTIIGGATLESGAISAVTALVSGGELVVRNGGYGFGSDILSGGLEVVGAGGRTLSDTVDVSGLMEVTSGGVVSGTAVLSGGLLRALSGGSALATLISSGGVEALSGGTATSTAVSSGGILRVSSGGAARGTVLSGGVASVTGVTSGTWVRAGGEELVQAHGTASGTTVGNSGRQVVAAGGSAVSTKVFGGGTETISSGGSVVGATVSAGGTLTVSSGGAVSGGLTLHGGKAVISGTMAAGQTVSFVGTSGVLELDNLPGFAAKISGLTDPTDKLDFGGFTFSVGETAAWTQSGTSGTLTVTDGAKVASLTLIGTYTSSSFHLTDDGHGGTFVADPPAGSVAGSHVLSDGHGGPPIGPPIDPPVAGFAQFIAGFNPAATASFAVASGGTASGFALLITPASSAGRA